MDSYSQIYESYRRYAESIGSPVLPFEEWHRLRHRLDADDNYAQNLREQWLEEANPLRADGRLIGGDSIREQLS